MPRGQELGVHLGTTHRGEQALALRNAESTFPQTQVLALRSADSKAGRTSARFTKCQQHKFRTEGCYPDQTKQRSHVVRLVYARPTQPQRLFAPVKCEDDVTQAHRQDCNFGEFL